MKCLTLGLLLVISAAVAAPFKIQISRYGDTSIRRYDDAEFAKSFNYKTIEDAYPYIDIDNAKQVPSNAELKAICKNSVLKILKSPGSAKFPELGNASYSAPGGVYYVSGSVDSQNSYGALLRKKFYCVSAFTGNLKGGTIYTFADLFEN